ncbi:MAG: STAS-like domain-containing protein [Cyclobacteriaceae bacterium]
MVEAKTILKVSEIIGGDTAVSTDDGQKIFDLLAVSIQGKQAIAADFSGIQIMTTAFLNAAIGQLYSQFTSEELNSYLNLVNINSEDRILFKKVVERAKQYFKDQKSFDNAVNQGLDG